MSEKARHNLKTINVPRATLCSTFFPFSRSKFVVWRDLRGVDGFIQVFGKFRSDRLVRGACVKSAQYTALSFVVFSRYCLLYFVLLRIHKQIVKIKTGNC